MALVAWLIVVSFCIYMQFCHWSFVEQPETWFDYCNSEITFPLFILLALPATIQLSRLFQSEQNSEIDSGDIDLFSGVQESEFRRTYHASPKQRMFSCVFLCIVAIGASASIGYQAVTDSAATGTSELRFIDLPPAYHDEYSYLLQAETFLDGRLSYPPMSIRPDLFHQMHVLNEHRTASRYFPLTGAWIAPFLALGIPVWGHYLAGGLAVCFFYLTLTQYFSQRVSLFSALLLALSPGTAIFSNLLLAHHPVMLALSIFTWSFCRMLASRNLVFTVISGTTLALAMLGRPMTAAGFGLPFGIVFVISILRSRHVETCPGWKHLAVMAVPLFAGFGILAVHNHEVTGSWSRTAYQEYTDTYTPRHRYGFNNVTIGELVAGAKTLDTYDRWATNLTLSAAARNIRHRLFASCQWTLGVVPVMFGILITLPCLPRCVNLVRRKNGLSLYRSPCFLVAILLASILSLHAVHVPYWFDGIMHWHYVFETAPLLLLLTGIGLCYVWQIVRISTNSLLPGLWVIGLVLCGLFAGWFGASENWGMQKLSMPQTIDQISYSRKRIEYFRRMTSGNGIVKPALILVDESGTDPHLSYIINPPDLKSDILVCRLPKAGDGIDELRQGFSRRKFYQFDPGTLQFTFLPETQITDTLNE